ncbi:MAG: rare lipoprotein [Micromonosporaceae bacterium]
MTGSIARSIPSATAPLSTKGWTLSGKHALERTSSTLIPVLSGLAIAALLVVGAIAAMNLGPARNASVQVAESPSPVPAPVPSRTSERRASRGQLRAVPVASPSRSPAKSPTKKASPPAGGGSVTSTGSCQASYYGTGQTTANGEHFDPNGYTAAHKTLPFNTRIRVTNTSNGKSVVVRINDRGPFVNGRCLDLTPVAFGVIASVSNGVVSVKYEVLS